MEPNPAHRRPGRRARALHGCALVLIGWLAGCSAPTLDLDGADGPLPDRFTPIDDGLAESGAWLFRRNCAACHHLGEGDRIGPDLAGVTERRSYEWIEAMIRRPDSMLVVDSIAQAMLLQYQVPMANRRLGPERVRALLEFLRRADRGGAAVAATDTTASGIAWTVVGDGPAVVLIHGTNLDRRAWTRVVGLLAGTHTVLSYDLRTHGRSVDADGPWSDVADLIEVMDAAGLPEATVVGLSAGAGIALEAVATHPERVSGLVLASPSVRGFVPAPGEVPDVFGPLMAALGTGDPDAIADALFDTPTFEVGPDWSESVRTMVRDNVRLFGVDPTWAAPPHIRPLDAMDVIEVPARVVVGGSDFPAVRRLARELASGLSRADLVEVPGAPHLLPLTHPETVADAVLSLSPVR